MKTVFLSPKLIPLHPLPWTGRTSTIPDCSKPIQPDTPTLNTLLSLFISGLILLIWKKSFAMYRNSMVRFSRLFPRQWFVFCCILTVGSRWLICFLRYLHCGCMARLPQQQFKCFHPVNTFCIILRLVREWVFLKINTYFNRTVELLKKKTQWEWRELKFQVKSHNLTGIRCVQGQTSLLNICTFVVSSEKSGG